MKNDISYLEIEMKEFMKSVKCNREFIVWNIIHYLGAQVIQNFVNLKLYYLMGEKNIFMNNSTARNKLKYEECQIIDEYFDECKVNFLY
jgi:hypothetical protein